MPLEVKRDVKKPYPFDPSTTPTSGWETLDAKRLDLAEPCLLFVLAKGRLVTIPTRQVLSITFTQPNQIRLESTTHSVIIQGSFLMSLYIALSRGDSCVMYEWRSEWKDPPKELAQQIDKIEISSAADPAPEDQLRRKPLLDDDSTMH